MLGAERAQSTRPARTLQAPGLAGRPRWFGKGPPPPLTSITHDCTGWTQQAGIENAENEKHRPWKSGQAGVGP